MPKLNKYGNWCAGKGGGLISFGDGVKGHSEVVIPYQSGDACWFNDFVIIGQHCDEVCTIKGWNRVTRELALISNSGGSHVEAGGDIWAKWNGSKDPETRGIMISDGHRFPDSDLGIVGLDGEVVYKVNYFSAGPWNVYEPKTGNQYRLYDGDIGNISSLGRRRFIFNNQLGQMVGVNTVTPVLLGWPAYHIKAYEVYGEVWVQYQLDGRLITHPWNSKLGHVITTGETNFPDAIQMTNGNIKSIWARVLNDSDVDFVEWSAGDAVIDLSPVIIPVPEPKPIPVPIPVPVEYKPMRLPDFAQSIVNKLYLKFNSLALGDDAARTDLCRKIVETITFNDPSGRWGHKRQKGGGFSKDTLGKIESGLQIGFDLFNGSTRRPNDHPDSFRLDDATQEVSFFAGVNWLEDAIPAPGPSPAPDSDLLTRFKALEAKVARLEDMALVDGSRVALRTDNSNYVCAEGGGGGEINATRTQARAWETLTVVKK